MTLQSHGITVETTDLAEVFARMRKLKLGEAKFQARAAQLQNYSSWQGVPSAAFENIVRLGVVIDDMIAEMGLGALSIRCWLELQQEFGISPCVLLGELNDRGVPAACELDTGSAVMMYALQQASGGTSACLDWNNNYDDEENKCILFHCGPVPRRMMTGKGEITDHSILMTALGPGRAYGCNAGRVAATPFTFGGLLTKAGKICAYLGEGDFTNDPIPAEFFGCAGVAEIPKLAGRPANDRRTRTSASRGRRAGAVCRAAARSDGEIPRFRSYAGLRRRRGQPVKSHTSLESS